MQQLEPLILRFDVDDKGSVKVENIGRNVDALGDKMKTTEGKAKATGTAFGGLGAFLSRVPGPMAAVTAGANFLTGSLVRLQSVVFSLKTFFLALTGVLAAYSFISAASQVEQYELRLRQLTGTVSEGNRIFADAAKYASTVSFAYNDVLESAVKLRSTIAGTPEQVETLLRLSGDIASTYGIKTLSQSTDQLVRAFASGIGSADQWREQGVAMGLGFQQGVTYTTEETVQKISDAWLGMDSNIRGASANLVDTFSGQMSMLGDKWFQFRAMVMDAGLFDLVKDSLAGTNAVLELWINNSKEAFGQGMNTRVQTLRGSLEQVGDVILTTASGTYAALALILDIIEGIERGIYNIALAGAKVQQTFEATDKKVSPTLSKWFDPTPAFELADLAARSARDNPGTPVLARAAASSMTKDGSIGSFLRRPFLGNPNATGGQAAEEGSKPGFTAADNIQLLNEELKRLDDQALSRNFNTNLAESAKTIEAMKKSLREAGSVFKEAFNKEGAAAVVDNAEAREADAAALLSLVKAQAAAEDGAIAAMQERQSQIDSIVGQLTGSIEDMRRRSLSGSSSGLQQLFEEDVHALRRTMEELGIFQEYEREFLEYRAALWEQTSEAIIRAMQMEEEERRRQLYESDNYFAGLKGGIENWADAVGSGYQQAARVSEDALNATRNAMADFLVSVSNDVGDIKEHFRSLAISVVQSLQRIAAQALATAILMAILAPLTGGGAPVAMMALNGMGNAAGGSEWAYQAGPQTYHSGGLVNSGRGPSPDEVSTVLQRGEYVVSRRGVAALDQINSGNVSGISGRAQERQVERVSIISEEDILTFAERSGRFRQMVVQIAREDGGMN
jgi:lambda family phage tail tape measure protein